MDGATWGAILERYGYPTLILVIVSVAFWKGLWPYIKKQLDHSDVARQEAQRVVTDQLEKAEKRIEKADQTQVQLVLKVTEALEEHNRLSRRLVESMDQVLERTKHL